MAYIKLFSTKYPMQSPLNMNKKAQQLHNYAMIVGVVDDNNVVFVVHSVSIQFTEFAFITHFYHNLK